jgi:hypothetical protein
MKWETPAFVEINMSAEIGGYGSDFTDRDPWGPMGSLADSAATADRTEALTTASVTCKSASSVSAGARVGRGRQLRELR